MKIFHKVAILVSFLFLTALLAACSYYGQRPYELVKAAPAPVALMASESLAPPPAAPPVFNTEQYERREENRFLETMKNPLSTFSIDVDTASYANVRRMLGEKRLPPPDAVRIEEMINYFSYDYPGPQGSDPFSITTELSAAPWQPAHQLLQIAVQGKKVDLANLPPGNLVFLLDVSGSMSDPDKLPLLTSSLKLLVNELRPQDRVAIVVYAGAAGVVLPSTPGSEKPQIIAALDSLQTGGSTAGGEGILLAYRIAKANFMAGGNNRVILCTDGDFNVGASSDGEMERLIEAKRKEGVFLTVLGFGTGNYQDAKMQKLADRGNGNYAYIDSLLEARKVLVSQMGGTLLTIAKDVKIQVEFNPAQVESYRLIGYEKRMLRAEDFADDSKDAGELGAGHTVTALYEIVPTAGTTAPVESRYLKTEVKGEAANVGELALIKFRYKKPTEETSQLLNVPIVSNALTPEKTSDNFRFAAAVAGWGMLLTGSDYRGSADMPLVLKLARGAKGSDEMGYRAEMIRLAELSGLLGKK